MDPVSQGALGAAFAQSTGCPSKLTAVAVCGAVAGMAPDLDVLIRSSSDPLLFLDYHRQFTHALIFIPVGAMLVALPFMWLFRRALSRTSVYLACLLGYATHGLLDACTSYGTQLLWPFSDLRVAWNTVSVVDPLFTIPLLVAVVAAAWRKRRRYALLGVAWALAYLLLGWVQHERALTTAQVVATERGHHPGRLTVKPTFGNLLLWKSIYEHEGAYFIDAIHAAVGMRHCPGTSVQKLDLGRDLPNLEPGTEQHRDLERFNRFSAGYLAYGPMDGSVYDVRYSLVPDEADPLWGIRLSPSATAGEHVAWWTRRRPTREQRERMLSLLAARNCLPIPRQGP